jgi:peptidoglycan LD-endopeptidase LytH
MNKFWLFSMALFLICLNKVNNTSKPAIGSAPGMSLNDVCTDYNELNTQIRDGLISKKEAAKRIQDLMPLIKNYYYAHGGHDLPKAAWKFPLQNYGPKAVGGKNGDGFIESGYNFFDGNKHGGHPAHDIFINDRNQDCLDDKTQQPVNVLSMTDGIVIALATQWATLGNLRGGKYIYIYQPSTNSLFYYAHNSEILVHLCDIVKPGQVIAKVGRTGLNAYKKRSPTHLHFMQLTLDSQGTPRPFNPYKDLLTASSK